MCGNLIKKGNLGSPLILYNRTASRAQQLAQELGNCSVANSPSEAVAGADIIFTCLTDDHAVLELFRQILDNDVTGKLFVNCSTTQPATSDDLAAMVEKKGAGVVTMPGKFGVPRPTYRASKPYEVTLTNPRLGQCSASQAWQKKAYSYACPPGKLIWLIGSDHTALACMTLFPSRWRRVH